MTLRTFTIWAALLFFAAANINTAITVAGISPFVLAWPLVLVPFLFRLFALDIHPLRPSPAAGIMLLFCVVLLFYVFMAFLNPNPFGTSTRSALITLINTTVIIVLLLDVKKRSEIDRIHKWFIWITILQIILCLYEINTGNHLSNSRHYDPDFNYTNEFIPTGTFYNENQTATMLAMGFVFLLYRAITTRSRLQRLFLAVAAILCLYCIFYTESRINMVICVVILLNFVIRRAGFALLLMGIGSIVLVTGVINSADLLALIESQIEASSLESLQNPNSSAYVRIYLSVLATELIFDSNPLAGLLGTQTGAYVIYCMQKVNLVESDICQPHNWPLELMADYGISSFFVYLYLFVIIVAALLRIKRTPSTPGDRTTANIYLGVLLVQFGASFSVSSITIMIPMWAIMGYMVAFIRIADPKDHRAVQSAIPQPP